MIVLIADHNKSTIASIEELNPSFQVELGDPLAFDIDAVVSPANTKGNMNGGYDAVLRRYFGLAIEYSVRQHLEKFQNAPWSVDRVKDFLSRAWLPIFVLGWNATAFALQTVRALMLDESDKLYVMAARARGVSGMSLLWRYPAKHSLGPVINSNGFDLNRIFSALPVVALILVLTEAGALLIEALARSNDQQLAGAIIFLLTATIVFVNFVTDIILAIMDPRIRKGVMGGD